jgi:hypothetical protein
MQRMLRSASLALLVLLVAAPTALGGADPLLSAPSRVSDPAATTRVADGLTAGTVDRTSISLTATYDVRATLRYDVPSITVVTDLSVRNTSGGPIDYLQLNVAPARIGRMQLHKARVDGIPVAATVTDQTLRVPLGGVLAEGATVPVRIGYTAWFNTATGGSNWMFAKANGVVQGYRWIPWISRPTAFDRPNFGDPYVTPVSPRVKVTFTTDRTLRIASTGRRTSSSGLVQVFEATDVRDFNFTAAPDYRTVTDYAGDTRIVVYFRSGSGSAILSAAQNAIDRFEALVGAYPYPDLIIGQSGAGYGLESPGHIWIPASTASSSVRYLVSHETAHQWFYATVGNDQASEPYADEAAADFITRYVLGNRRGSNCSTARLDLTIYQYSGACYYEVVYIQGGNYLDDLRLRIGNPAFWAGLRDYYATWRFKLSGTEQLLQTLDEHTTQDLVPSYHSRFPRYF